ncbi:hypothetical protein HZ994_08030 [Akkermansiaceae bacterium]|nr:hypothetical protein HZ994_08030 [Akkermansiaceae bacterium]
MIPRLTTILLLATAIAPAQAISTPRLSCRVVQTAEATTLATKAKGSDEELVFEIGWETGTEKVAGFGSSTAENGIITSTHRLGKTTLTRTILASAAADCILIHIIADKPGAVCFRARFRSDHPARIRNRREILLSGEKIQAHAWIIPFESDVRDDGKGTVILDGEGEALIILNLTADQEASPIADTLTRLGKKHDPGHSPPGPHLIWEGIKEERARGRPGEGGGEE